jgi:molybdopterin-synthase adenylyltransferase
VTGPAIKDFYRIYRREGEDAIFIGQGPDKVVLERPTPEMEAFVRALDGTRSHDELRAEFPATDEWLGQLGEAGVLEERNGSSPLDLNQARRYARQVNYLRLHERPGWSGHEAQARILGSRVVVVGTGAGGTTLVRLLTAAGVGTLEVVDFDDVELDNLATHGALDEEDVGGPKLEAVRRHAHRQSSGTTVVCHDRRIGSADELLELVEGADFLLQAYDRPREHSEAARWTNEAGLATGVPFSSIGATDKGARAGPIVVPGRSSCFECIGIPELEFLRYERAQALTAATVFMLAGIMVGEILKVLTGSAPSRLVGRSLYVDTESLEFTFTEHPRRADCTCSRVPAAAPA